MIFSFLKRIKWVDGWIHEQAQTDLPLLGQIYNSKFFTKNPNLQMGGRRGRGVTMNPNLKYKKKKKWGAGRGGGIE